MRTKLVVRKLAKRWTRTGSILLLFFITLLIPTQPSMAQVSTGETIIVTDISPDSGSFAGRPAGGTKTAGVSNSGRMTALAVSANGQRLYAAAANTGLWRSSDGGLTWCQLTTVIPCVDGPASALPVPVISEVAIAPNPTDGSVVLAAAAFDTHHPSQAGIYRSIDSGGTWHRVHEFKCSSAAILPAIQVRFAPDDPNLIFASGGCTIARSSNGGVDWTEVAPGEQTGVQGDRSMFYLAVSEFDSTVGNHWLFACGAGGFFFSSTNGETWTRDTSGTVPASSCGYGGAPHLLATEPGQPGRVFMARYGLSNAPRFFDPNQAPGTQCNTSGLSCGEASLWHGTFQPSSSSGVWNQLSSPPTYYGDPSIDDSSPGTPSGAPFVITKLKPDGGYLLFFSDEGVVHVYNGRPPIGYNPFAGWHRLDGWDPWAYTAPGGGRRGHFIHPDPYDLAVTSDFSLTLVSAPVTCFDPTQNPLGLIYCGNSALASGQGNLWIANDGGVFGSDREGAFNSWSAARSGLSTLMFNGAAVLARSGRRAAAIYTGSQDNSSFFYNPDRPNPDNGNPNWGVAENCGDCAGYFADTTQTDRVVHVDLNRSRAFGLYVGYSGAYPSPVSSQTAQLTAIPYPVGGDFASASNRPVVQTLLNELPLLTDLVRITTITDDVNGGTISRLYRTTNPTATAGGWQPIGPPLPANILWEQQGAVQVSGGHTRPTYYLRSPNQWLYKSVAASDGSVTRWTPIVLGTGNNGACLVRSFFADPYNPQRIFLDDPGTNDCTGGIKRSDDGGQSWQPAHTLQAAITDGGYTLTCNQQKDGPACPINDMLFVRGEAQTIYTAGITGVFATSDGGLTWRRLMSNTDLPCDPAELGLDAISALRTRTLYVFCWGRSILRLDSVRAPSTDVTITAAAGGSLTSSDEDVYLEFPAHAVSSDHVMHYIHGLAAAEPLPSDEIGLHHFILEATGSDGHLTTQFQQNYSMTVTYKDAQLAFHGLREDRLNLDYWNGQAWVHVLPCPGCQVDTVHKHVVVSLNHFTEFALVGSVERKIYLPIIQSR